MPEYILILSLLFIFTFTLHKLSGVKLFKNFRHLIYLNLIVFTIAIFWDQFAIYRGHWRFNPDYLLGPKIGLMPIEEFLFIIVCEYFGLVIYKFFENQIN